MSVPAFRAVIAGFDETRPNLFMDRTVRSLLTWQYLRYISVHISPVMELLDVV
jgi:hypothetical protein